MIVQEKKILIRNAPGTPHYKVIYEGGGEIPKDLLSLYTSEKEAQKAIDLYLIKKNRKNASSSSQ